MTSVPPSSTRAPLHHRFDRTKSIQLVRNRYKGTAAQVTAQVELLQKYQPFIERCSALYAQGFKDWAIAMAIANCMTNWRASELKTAFGDNKAYEAAASSLTGTTYPVERFVGDDFEIQIQMHSHVVLRSYGFSPRQRVIKPDVLLKFLKERLRHFDFDLEHAPLFGAPPGDWPTRNATVVETSLADR